MSIGQIGIIIAIAAGVAWAFRRIAARSRYAVADADTCAGCGYNVYGLPSAVCPECGADLSRAGAIRPRGWRLPMSRDGRVFGWSAVLWAGFWGVNVAWLNRVPDVLRMEVEANFQNPRSDRYQSVTLKYKGESYLGKPLSGRGRLTLRDHKGRERELPFDVRGNAIRTASGPLDPPRVLAWMSEAGVDVAGPAAAAVKVEVDDMVAAALSVSATGSRGGARGFSAAGMSYSGSGRATYPVTAARWALAAVWFAGVVVLWRADRVRHPRIATAARVL